MRNEARQLEFLNNDILAFYPALYKSLHYHFILPKKLFFFPPSSPPFPSFPSFVLPLKLPKLNLLSFPSFPPRLKLPSWLFKPAAELNELGWVPIAGLPGARDEPDPGAGGGGAREGGPTGGCQYFLSMILIMSALPLQKNAIEGGCKLTVDMSPVYPVFYSHVLATGDVPPPH